jgi:hypothetical protein
MPEQEFDLLEIATALAAELGTGSAQVTPSSFFACSRPFIERRVDTFLQRTYAPTFDPAHLSVKLALKRLWQRQELFVGKGFGELNHAPEILLGVSPTVLPCQHLRD